MKKASQIGFTLIELMIVVVIVAILMGIAIPSYQHYVRKNVAAQAQQEIQKLAEQLERHKTRNFTYRGFNAKYLYQNGVGVTNANFDESKQELKLPIHLTTPKYTLIIVDETTSNPLLTSTGAVGQGWAIKAVSSDPKNDSFLMASNGTRCRNLTANNISYSTCGSGASAWD